VSLGLATLALAYISLGGMGGRWGGLKVSPPCMKFLFKAIAKFFRKKGMFEEIFDFFG
jgi:hypothetical protein